MLSLSSANMARAPNKKGGQRGSLIVRMLNVDWPVAQFITINERR